jgi:hypothetical protein
MSVKDSLKELRSKYSYMNIYKELICMMKEEYEELTSFFMGVEEKKEESVKRVVVTKNISKKETAPPVQMAHAVESVPAVETPIVQSDSKQMKQWQKTQEQKKFKELTAAGIVPESLLTQANLKKWIEEEGKTYAYVSREYLGISEARTAEFGKKHGITSRISKRRAMVGANAVVRQLRS